MDNDASYPNSTYNPDEVQSNLTEDDYVLLESFAVNTQVYTPYGFETKSNWKARVDMALAARKNFDINVMAVCMIDDTHASGQALFTFAYTSAVLVALDGFGSANKSYGSTTAATKYWTRPDISNLGEYWEDEPSIAEDGNKYIRYLADGKLTVDFTSGSETSCIEQA